MKSSKKYITEYIVLKILKDDYKSNTIVPSENKLAIKFGCSRLTSRSALISLVNADILDSHKGKGYVVSENALSLLFLAKQLINDAVKSTYTVLEDLNIITPTINPIKNECHIILNENYDSLNNLISFSYIIINKKELEEYFENGYDFDTDSVNKIINTGFIPKYVNTYFLNGSLNNEELLQKIKYSNGNVPIIEQQLYNDNDKCIIRTISIGRKERAFFEIKTKVTR